MTDVIDPMQLARFTAALVLVLGLMGGLALILKKISEKQGFAALTPKKRLKIVETLNIDTRRKLVIVQCDGNEHLIILGGNSETLIESNLESKQDKNHAGRLTTISTTTNGKPRKKTA